MLIGTLVWNVFLGWLLIVDPHPHLDIAHCWTDRPTWTRYCWPKRGCFVDGAGNALCWQIARLK